MKEFCVYLTIYLGNAFSSKFNDTDIVPTMYYGCCMTKNILNEKYVGSVKSTQYAEIWEYERRHNFHLFDVQILKQFDTREEALAYEKELQRIHNVCKSPHYFNKMESKSDAFGGARHGEANSMAKKYKIVPPKGEPFNVIGGLKKFCDEHNLSLTVMRTFINNGPVRLCDFQKSFTTERSRNCVDWQIELIA